MVVNICRSNFVTYFLSELEIFFFFLFFVFSIFELEMFLLFNYENQLKTKFKQLQIKSNL